ncbi:hypothetical protein ACG83_36070 [Frankia sp. R43]|nr:hypothetical protein ACG83_36070 [Frankia sp. R43]
MVSAERERIQAALPAYEVGEALGQGAYGLVFAARHRLLGRDVAIKHLLPLQGDLPARPSEARVLASMNHPHIVKIHDYVEAVDEGGQLRLIVMELLEKETLHSRLRGQRSRGEFACAVGVAVAEALAYAHAHDVIHRDIKPHNILFDERNQVKVADFGIAKIIPASGGTVRGLTGTPIYMAPEQMFGGRLGPYTDVYALGVVMREMLTGAPPSATMPPPGQQQPDPDPDAALTQPAGAAGSVPDVVRRALAQDPAVRPSAVEFARDLAAAAAHAYGPDWISSSGVRLHLDPEVRRRVRAVPRPPTSGWRPRPLAAMAALLVAVLVVVVGLSSWLVTARSDARKERAGRQAAVVGGLLAHADRLVDSDPELAIRLALAANSVVDNDETRAALQRTLTSTGYRGYIEHEGVLRAVAFSPKSERIAFAGDNGEVIVEGLPRGRPGGDPITLSHGARVNAIAFADSRTLVTAGEDGRVLLWNVESAGGKPTELLGHDRNPVRAIAFAEDRRTLATADAAGRVLLRDILRPDSRPTELPGHRGSVNAVAFGKNLTLATGGEDGVLLWDLSLPDSQPTILPGHDKPVSAVAFSAGGDSLATADRGGTTRVWKIAGSGQSGAPVVLPPRNTEYSGPITGLAYAPDGRLITVNEGDWVDVRDAANPNWILSSFTYDHGAPALAAAVALDGKTLAVAGEHGGVLLWSLAPDGQPHILGGLIPGLYAADMTFAPDGTTLFAAVQNTIRVLNVADPTSPQNIGETIPLNGFGTALETTVAGCGAGATFTCRLAVSSDTGRFAIFDITDRGNSELFVDQPAHPGKAIHDMQFSDDGKLLVTGAQDGQVALWNVTNPRQPVQVGGIPTAHKGAVRDVEFGRAGQGLLATAGDDNAVRLWDVNDPAKPQELSELRSPPLGPVNDITFSMDGKTLFAGGDDGNVWIWNIESGGKNATLMGRLDRETRSPVYDLTFLGEDILIVAGEGQAVSFWDVRDRRRPRQLGPGVAGHFGAVVDTNVARDKPLMATAGADGTIRLWGTESLRTAVPDDVAATACSWVGSGPGRDDWALYIPNLPYRETCRS